MAAETHRSKSVGTEYEPHHVCELCHKLYRLYGSKKAMLLSCDAPLVNSLIELEMKPVENWNSDDIKFIIEIYGHTLPTIKSTTSLSPLKKSELRYRNVFYGYQSIVETPVPTIILDTDSEKLQQSIQLSDTGKRDYVKLNIKTSFTCNPNIKKQKEKTMKFENSAAPKISAPEEMVSLYKQAQRSQRCLVNRLKKSIG